MKNKVALIIPYYGRLPSYFPLFISSMKNKPLDVLFFTNQPEPENLPSNIIWKTVEFDEVKKLFDEKLKMNVSLDSPYKFCDLRPAFGLVFEDFLEEYDFWGTSDVDLVIDNFEKFINDEVLSKTDVYSCAETFLTGPFFLLRNNSYCNTLFENSKDWLKVCTTKKYLRFDECDGNYFVKLRRGVSIFDLNTRIQSFTEILFIEAQKGLRLLFTDTILETKGTIPVQITENEVLYKGKEYLLLHYLFIKQKFYFYANPAIKNLPCYINSFGTFKNKPSFIKILISVNLLNAIKNLPYGVVRRIKHKYLPPDKNNIRYLEPII